MKKRFGFLSMFGITALLLVMVGAITVLAAPAAAPVDGTIEVRAVGGTAAKAWFTQDNVVEIRVTDADRNVTVATTAEVTLTSDLAAGGGNVAVDLTLTDEPNTPIAGTPTVTVKKADGTADTRFTSANFNVSIQFADRGTLYVYNYATTKVDAGEKLVIAYNEARKNILDDPAFPGDATKLLVKVTSTQDTTGQLVQLDETGADTGVFTGKVTLVAAASEGPVTDTKMRIATTGDVVTFTYTDKTPAVAGTTKTVTTTAKVDKTKPAISNISPADKFSTQIKKPELRADFIDADSGVDPNELKVSLDGSTANTTCSVTAQTGGVYRLICAPMADLAEGDHPWQLIGKDVAGVEGKSDADADTTGDQTFTISVDTTPPSADFTATTGIWWDASKTTTDKSETTASKAVTTSMRLVFNEKLSAATVEPGDFTVEGTTISSASVYTKNETFVFLTLGTALGSAATPKVNLVGAVNDLAGNSRPGPKEVTAVDGIGPKVTTPTVDKTLIKGDGSVVVTIVANEALNIGRPTLVAVYKAGDAVTAEKTVTADVITDPAVANKWTVTIKGADLGDGGVAAGQKKTVYVEVYDVANNKGTKGSKDTTSTSAVLFTVDKTAPTVALYTPLVDGNVYTTAPFVSIKWSEKVSITKAEFRESTATTWTDVTAKLGPITATFDITYAASGLTVGKKYEFRVAVGDAVDVAGNKSTTLAQTSFTVKAKALVEIPLSPGMNLISLPGEVADPAINSVITSADVSLVTTYDSATGKFLSATRGADGKLAGDLKTIDAKHAYWVQSSSFAPIKVDVPVQAAGGAFPPYIPVVAGWNLVPVVSVSGAAPGTTISADTYFGSIQWVTAYGFNAPDAWAKKLPKTAYGGISTDTVEVGKGYWVFVTVAGILVP